MSDLSTLGLCVDVASSDTCELDDKEAIVVTDEDGEDRGEKESVSCELGDSAIAAVAVEVSTGLDDAVNDTIGATEMAPLPLLWYVATDVDDAQSEERALVDTTGDDDVVLLMEVNAVAIATDVLDTSGDTVRDAYAVIDDRALIDTSTDKVRFGEGLITGDDEGDEVLKAEAETVRVALTVGGPVDAGDKVGEFFGDAESVCPAEMLGKEEAAAVFDGTVADALALSRDDDVALADDSGERDGLVVVDDNTVSDALPD